jgi:Peptidase MA superfamily
MRPRTRKRGLLSAFLAGAIAASSPAIAAPGDDRIPDRVELSNGAKIEGRIVFEDANRILLQTGTGEKSFDKKNVKSSRSRARLHDDLFDRWLALDDQHLSGVLDLARMAKQTDLREDSECFAARALLLDKSSPEAHDLLGHRKRGSTWDLEFRKDRWLSFEKVLAIRDDWGDAFDLASMHYVVRTNFGLTQEVEAALDLESFYRAFFELFGQDLELREVLDPMTVEIHADKKSFPPIASGRTAYTDTARNWVEIDASASATNGPDLRELIHEATHQLVAALTVHSFSGAGGAVPGWLGEGLAEYVAGGMGGLSGRRKFSQGSLLPGHFAVHAAAKAPYELSRVLNFEADDFVASSKSDLKYAQAYTLVQFCMEGDGGKYRKGFLEYLRGVWRGKKSVPDFRKAMKVDEAAFEKAWIAHVRGGKK